MVLQNQGLSCKDYLSNAKASQTWKFKVLILLIVFISESNRCSFLFGYEFLRGGFSLDKVETIIFNVNKKPEEKWLYTEILKLKTGKIQVLQLVIWENGKLQFWKYVEQIFLFLKKQSVEKFKELHTS